MWWYSRSGHKNNLVVDLFPIFWTSLMNHNFHRSFKEYSIGSISAEKFNNKCSFYKKLGLCVRIRTSLYHRRVSTILQRRKEWFFMLLSVTIASRIYPLLLITSISSPRHRVPFVSCRPHSIMRILWKKSRSNKGQRSRTSDRIPFDLKIETCFWRINFFETLTRVKRICWLLRLNWIWSLCQFIR